MVANKFLTSSDQTTKCIIESGIKDMEALIRAVHRLPYGRNTDRADLTQVWTEQRGTCSSKHAFLKLVADANQLKNIKLKVCIFRMNSGNTPAISDVLIEHQISYIPEAHCYIEVDGQPRDITFEDSDIQKLRADILIEKEVPASFVIADKIDFHREYLTKWLQSEELPYDLDEFWKIRELCIRKLTAS